MGSLEAGPSLVAKNVAREKTPQPTYHTRKREAVQTVRIAQRAYAATPRGRPLFPIKKGATVRALRRGFFGHKKGEGSNPPRVLPTYSASVWLDIRADAISNMFDTVPTPSWSIRPKCLRQVPQTSTTPPLFAYS